MSGSLYLGLNAALLDMISVNGVTFTWAGSSYDCVLNADSATVITPKSQFANRSYPQRGDTIQILGKNQQVTAIGNSTSEYIDGGIIDISIPFTDDPTNPALLIAFRPFINK